MESSIVIKVKHEETLRRFNARVTEDGKLDLDMCRLKEIVLHLFSFAPDAPLALTYVDEDGDVVTLADEEDLHDVMSQSLNPLRITVKLNGENVFRSSIKSTASSTPISSSRVQHPFPNLSSNVSEILKSIPEPFLDSLLKLAVDLASKPASSSPVRAEIVDCFVKIKQPQVNVLLESQGGIKSSKQTAASMNAMDASIHIGTEGSKVDLATLELMRPATVKEPGYKTNEKVDLEKGRTDTEASVTPASGSLHLNSCVPVHSSISGHASANVAPLVYCNAGCSSKEAAEKLQVPLKLADGRNKHAVKSNETWKANGASSSSGAAGPMKYSTIDFNNTDSGGQSTMDFKTASRGTLETKFPTLNCVNECPFSGLPLASDSTVLSMQYGSCAPPLKGIYYHMGIICDGCGKNPITGPRFKSKVKEDYDLCSICFSEMGNEADYIRINHPVPRQQYDHPPAIPEILRSCVKPTQSKLDCSFIRDVNVLDGTIMAPSTPFTKIWTMQNNGTDLWPQGTQLVWIRGDKLRNAVSVELQIPPNGIPVNGELDVAVDFLAPELPGQYISYWRMASPSGHKFGELIWVLIQVDASPKYSLCNGFYSLNLNFPPASSSATGPETVNVNAEPMLVNGRFAQPNNSDKNTVLIEQNDNQEQNFHINSTLINDGLSNPVNPDAPTLVSYPIIDMSELEPVVPSHVPPATAVVRASAPQLGCNSNDIEKTLLRELEEMGFKHVDLNKETLRKNQYDLALSLDYLSNPVNPDAPTLVSYPIIDMSEVEPVVPSHVPPATAVVRASAPELGSNSNDVEKTLLRELEEMGFKHVDLNKEILRKNQYDLALSLDYLYAAAEWDPILKELEEMGFSNKEMNKLLLEKYNGSIKDVVMYLITGEE